jgi:3-oxoacyl-[acyl-carrier protein] reductase
MADKRKTALITGAGQNIGRSCALALADAGFNVVINGRRKQEQCEAVAKEAQAKGVDALVVMGNVGSGAACQALADAGIAKFGSIDVLLHNAAIRPEKPFLEMDEAEWHDVLNVNMNASFWLARACLPGMVEAGWGRIINFAGMNAMNGYNGRAHVSTSKHGNWGLTKALAKEFGPKGITVNIISPGPIKSEHDDPAMTKHINEQAAKIPVGRLGEPDEVAAVVRMLVSEGGAFVNGQMLQVNGGTQT